jgi:hypothetical protein
MFKVRAAVLGTPSEKINLIILNTPDLKIKGLIYPNPYTIKTVLKANRDYNLILSSLLIILA